MAVKKFKLVETLDDILKKKALQYGLKVPFYLRTAEHFLKGNIPELRRKVRQERIRKIDVVFLAKYDLVETEEEGAENECFGSI